MPFSKYFFALLLAPLLAVSPAAIADPIYTITFLPGDFSASALGRDGQVAGTSRGGAAIWSTSTTPYLASLLPGSEGLAINGTGAIAFMYAGGSLEHSGFRYSGGVFSEMGHFGRFLGAANAINAQRNLAGFAGIPTGDWADPDRHAAVYLGGTLHDLGTLGGRLSDVNDINDRGFVVGWSELAGGFSEGPFLFSPEGTRLTDLGSLGGSSGHALGINNAGTVVGLSDINDAGQILAEACNDSLAECRAVRLDLISAVPEPGAWAMLAGGLVLLLWRARRRTLWIAAAPLLAAPLASAQALPNYMAVFLSAGYEASTINARGHAAGYILNAAALWDGSMLLEYTASAPGSFALARACRFEDCLHLRLDPVPAG